ncbi:MAG: tRNA pseudouridine(13) synthase TruD, partial [Chromatiaceae bacterium]|nr:tRNA pseudouridine(13) synthase TruD [Chromatiaceae bacterium]
AVLAPFDGWMAGLARAGLKQERRALRLALPDLQATHDGSDLHLGFSLPAGAYATVVLRELLSL